MPPKPKRAPKRKRATRSNRAVNKIAPVLRMIGAYPTEVVATLRYVEVISLATTGGQLNSYKFRANSLYDPNLTGTGHQPFLFDQYAALYNHYDVLTADMSATVVPTVLNTGVATAVGIYVGDDSTAYTDFQTFMESRRGTNKVIPPSPISLAAGTIRSRFSAATFFSKSRDKGETTAIVTANPTEEAIFHLWAQPIDGSSSGNALSFIVTLVFKARFFEPKDVAGS